jgi:hypothetical protein
MKIIFLILFSTLVSNAFAYGCRTTGYMKNAASSFSVETDTLKNRDTLKDEVIIIPVVVHVLYNTSDQNISDAEVLSQITVLNNDYRRKNADTINTPMPFKKVAADTRIQFCLAKVDQQGKYTTGIIHKYTKQAKFFADDGMKFSSTGGDDAWDATKYLNIWVCNLSAEDSAEQTLAYTVLPGSPLEKDGVVIKYNVFGTIGNLYAPYNKGRTTTHEVGHWLGLKHLWGDSECGDDGIADTPPQQKGNNGCPSFPHISSCSINSYGDMFMDFMDFTNDACMNMFTEGQKAEMRSLFALGNFRNSFLNSTVCDSSNAEGGPLPKDSSTTLKITTYPNPFNNVINIVATTDSGIVGKILKIYSISGQLCLTKIIQSQQTILNVSKLPSGIYILKIAGNKSESVYKLIKVAQ